MAKLVEILARELKEWPSCTGVVGQAIDGRLHYCASVAENANGYSEDYFEFADDLLSADVTRAQWEAERARIANDELIEDPFPDTPDEALNRAANRKATQEAREIARTDTMTAEEQELSDIACGKRSKEDQALWDKVASNIFTRACDESIASYRPEEVEYVAVRACTYADAFMAERAKRMKGGE